MLTLTLSLDSLSIYVVLTDVVILLSYVLYIFQKKRNLEKSIKKISDFIMDYFSNSGVEVHASCFKVDGKKRFVAFIESQPLKRFRYSNVLEQNLVSHILRLTGCTVEKVFWRFPIQLNREAMLVDGGNGLNQDDPYFSDRTTITEASNNETSKDINVSEVSWEEFNKP